MNRFTLRTKVFLLFAGAALLTVVPALLLIAQSVEQRVYERAREELTGAAQALGQNWMLRDSLLLREANTSAVTPGLAEAWLAGDSARIGRLLTGDLDEDRLVLAADTTGEVLLGPQVDAGILRRAEDRRDSPSRPETTFTFLNDDGAPIRLAIWPVVTDSGVVGVVGVGTRLGAATLEDLKKGIAAGNTDLALVVGDSLIATTFPDSLADALDSLDVGEAVRSGALAQTTVGGLPYRRSLFRLPSRGTEVSVLLFRPIADELRVAKGIQGSLVGIGVAALLSALLLGWIVSRIVARPTQALVEATTHLAQGDFEAPLPPASSDEIGQLARAFGEMRSAVREREARLRSAQAEMIHREQLAAMGRLVAQLSHEINNPIYNIQNCLEALDRRGDPGDPNREFLELAQEELTRMAALTRQLLDQSRPLPDSAAPLDLNAVAKRVLALVRPELERRGVASRLALESELPEVVAHPDALQQVLANLVENAMDAMPGGGTLTVGTRSEAEAVEVWVEDTGGGISDEHLPHIFEAFYTTKPGIRGIGLGLFVSEGIVRGHRGRLTVESVPDRGSRFVIRLPRETLDPAFLDDNDDALEVAAASSHPSVA
ncbi:hypothetical protein BH23GEM4_BH23GEM4_01670 [soil metagenome]